MVSLFDSSIFGLMHVMIYAILKSHNTTFWAWRIRISLFPTPPPPLRSPKPHRQWNVKIKAIKGTRKQVWRDKHMQKIVDLFFLAHKRLLNSLYPHPLVVGSSKYSNWGYKMKHSIAILHHDWKQLDKYIVYSYSFPLEVKHLLMFFVMAT